MDVRLRRDDGSGRTAPCSARLHRDDQVLPGSLVPKRVPQSERNLERVR